ncbi:urease accessory protein UreD [Hansschlegelia zhihuaiae]|uniref:urease accessory protein UreD n=1 Tax=Hansschlegelia zhihuaiae TaxID=405005 RepID=UPI001FDF75FF|nr:urease accessory protein UreD [Hansschlegelia zhihuaiae]
MTTKIVDTQPLAGHDGEDAAPALRRQRAEGRIALRVEARGGLPRVTRLAESGSSRLRFPKAEHGLDGVMLNIAGGLACGDRMSVEAEVGPGAALALSTPGAERVYRSDGPDTRVSTRLAVEAGGAVVWAPQETILFDRARLARTLDAEVAPDAALTVYEAVAFGRQARGETVEHGLIEDRWRVRRGGRLVFAETLRLFGPIRDLLAKGTVAGGATSLATILHVAPDAEARLDAVREVLAGHDVEAGATAWNGVLVVRMLARLSEALRDAARAVLPILIGRPLPRVWTC